MSHTPGPWSFSLDSLTVRDADYNHVALTSLRAGEDEANARLIAEAPALLEELRSAAAALEVAADDYVDQGWRNLARVARKKAQKARAAIAKAEGQDREVV